ncbi:MAG: PilW family protein [bacterium]|jgi:type IV pilus assembly protein PilW
MSLIASAPAPAVPADRASPARCAVVRAQRGLSLVELLVGMTIGLFLTLGLLVMMSGTSRGFKVQDEFARMQEGGVEALRYIGDSLRLAGFYGWNGSPGGGTSVSLPALAPAGGQEVDTLADCGSGTNPPATNWALQVGQPLSGRIGLTSATVNATFPCILAQNFLDYQNHQILVTRGSNGSQVPDTATLGDLSDAAFDNDRLYAQADPARGLIFRGGAARFTALKAAGESARVTNANGTLVDAPIFEYQAHVYYLRPCSRPISPPACATTDDGGFPIPTLVRQQLVGRTMTELALVPGVERIGFVYGIDNVNNDPTRTWDGIPDTYVLDPATPAQWSRVVTVRVSVLVRSSSPNIGHDDSGKQYDLTSGLSMPFACSPKVVNDCAYRRHVFQQTFQVRNVAMRRAG